MFCFISESSVGTGAGCFPSGSTVYTENGPRDIETVQKGDMVLAADDTGKLVYSEVNIFSFQIICKKVNKHRKMLILFCRVSKVKSSDFQVLNFIDRDPNATRRFVEVTAENGVTITSTPSHLLLLAAADGWRDTFASNVGIGDVLLTRGPAGVMRPSRVVDTQYVTKRGVFAPLTAAGTILVDDGLASCYAMVSSHSLAHAAMTPLRWMSSWSSSRESARGVHWYANALYAVGDFVLPASYRYR